MVGAQAFRMVLRICYSSSLLYLRTVGAAVRITVTRNFILGGPVSWSDNSDLGVREESGRVIRRYF